MAEVSRTARVIQNAKVALFFYCINLVLQFFPRKIFLDYLGAELLGLNTTAQNLLQFLNLAESGIGAAVAFALYKPLSQKNRQEIIDIVSLQGWFYRWVGLFVIAGSVVLMAFFPWIFAKAEVPLIYAYGTFITFLIGALLGYYVNYKIIVLSADQKEYKITIETQGIKIIKIFIQMLAIWKLSHGYVWWMILEVIAALFTSYRLGQTINKEYPWLKTNISEGYRLKRSYSGVLVKTKQLFFHKLGGFVFTQTTPLVIYGFTNLKTVAVYGNYMLIMIGCQALVEVFSRGFNASVGNLVANGDKKTIKRVFLEIVTIRIFTAGLICLCIHELSSSFIKLWVGPEYVLPYWPMTFLVLIYFIQMSRTSDIFLGAYGLFQDIWAPVCECILNLCLSISLGYVWGISGIFFGVLVSQVVVVVCWKLHFLSTKGFKESMATNAVLYTKKIFLLLCSIAISGFLFDFLFCLKIDSFSDWIESSLFLIITYFFIGTGIFYGFDRDFRSLISRFITIWKLK